MHLNHALFFSVQFRTWNLLTLTNCYNQLLPFFYAFLVPYCNEFLRESWKDYICTIFFPRERLVRTREFCSCYYNFPLLYMYLNDQRVEIYLLNWPNYNVFLLVTFLILILSFWAVSILAVQAQNSKNVKAELLQLKLTPIICLMNLIKKNVGNRKN